MTIARLALNVVLLAGYALAIAPQVSAGEPLPEKRDVPTDYSTVTCPNEASARALIADYYRLNDKGAFDIYRFSAVLKQLDANNPEARLP